MIKLEELQPDAFIRGVVPKHPVKVIKVEFLGEDAITLFYLEPSGSTGERMLFRSDETTLEPVTEGRPWSFDGDGADFRLAAEAYRIHLAYLFDPLMAVHSSNVDPLPHQITAVYEIMLNRQPLRFLLADDPGAGKTIMAGLLIRELMVRGDLRRALIIAPGSLIEQWQDEMEEKFGVTFDIFTPSMVETIPGGNPFEDRSLLLARLDQLSRNDDLKAKLERVEWDLVIVDEAHKMSASFTGSEVKKTKRYQLGELVGIKTRHLLLMTATPHNGKEEDFQLFLALLDSDRFYGKFRDGVHQVDTSDLMRRAIKEELVKFDGTRLFPERRCYTANYDLSNAEAALYESVTEYVKEQMNKADQLEDKKRKGTVGFALTILQRRLASSPEAIYQSLKRRRERLERRLEEEKLSAKGKKAKESDDLPWMTDDEVDDFQEDATDLEIEQIEEKIVGQATASETVAELGNEIAILHDLERKAHALKLSGQDRKWEELSRLLQDRPEMIDANGVRRKLIVFTEHRDTLNYLYDRITNLLGNEDGVRVIHGGVKREKRKAAQEEFTQNRDVVMLVATDAAGEGINLQRANLMVNYDLPWNPNRLEQRFGRIHRIGQTEICHMWNMVAHETREGDVFMRLCEKLETEGKAFKGRVFDILGEVFQERSLKDMLIEAIRYGEKPEIREKIRAQVDMFFETDRLKKIMEQSALAADHLSLERVFAVKEELEKAQARRLQPHFIQAFFEEAFSRTSGQLKEREPGRYEISFVPSAIRQADKVIGNGRPVLKKYERVTFERERVRIPGKPLASLICPGHPLMNATLDLMLQQYRDLLKRGTILVDTSDNGTKPHVLFIIDHSIRDGSVDHAGKERIISRRMQFIRVWPDGRVSQAGYAPYLDYRPLEDLESTRAFEILREPWLTRDLEKKAMAHAAQTLVPEHLDEIKDRRTRMVDTTIKAVQERLVKEIQYWTHRAITLDEEVKAGKQPRIQPENARRRAQDLNHRLEYRIKELEDQRHISSSTPMIVGGSLIVPYGLLASEASGQDEWCTDPVARQRIEKMAMRAVIEAEEALGHRVEDVSAANCGWDLTAYTEKREMRFIEVKGRAKGTGTVTVTKNEILTGFNSPASFILAVVLVDGSDIDGPHYIRRPFEEVPSFAFHSINYDLNELISRAVPPQRDKELHTFSKLQHSSLS
jgi:superfamily II DNA or RNA helicase